MKPSLLQRAHHIEEWAERHFLDLHGIVYTYIDTENEKAITDSFFGPDQSPIFRPGIKPADWHNYENCSMATAAYMMGLIYRYRVEKDPIALARARRSLDALRYIYDLGRQLEEGFLPKIYGDKFSPETSTDQVLYVMYALDAFHPHATPEEQQEIDRMIGCITRFWMNRGYRYTYFWNEDMLWPLNRFPPLLLMAYNHTGHEAFLHEYDRLLALGVTPEAVEARLYDKKKPEYQPTPYEKKTGAYLISDLDGSVSMGIMEMAYLLQHDPANPWAENWKLSIQQQWDEAKLALVPDGTQYTHVLVDMKTGEASRPQPGFFRENANSGHPMGDWVGFRYTAGCRSADATLIARALVQAHAHLPSPDMAAAARHVFQSLDIKDLRAYYDPDRYLPELQHRTKLYSGDGMASWLWGYWQGRADKVFGE